MATVTYVVGESGTLGFPVSEWDGTPIATTGLSTRLVIYRTTDPDITLPGTWTAGEVVLPGSPVPVSHPAIATFAVTSAEMPLDARAYPCALQLSDGTGWQTIGNHTIDARRP